MVKTQFFQFVFTVTPVEKVRLKHCVLDIYTHAISHFIFTTLEVVSPFFRLRNQGSERSDTKELRMWYHLIFQIFKLTIHTHIHTYIQNRQYISVAQATQCVVLCYGSISKLIDPVSWTSKSSTGFMKVSHHSYGGPSHSLQNSCHPFPHQHSPLPQEGVGNGKYSFPT